MDPCPKCCAQSISRRRIVFSRRFADYCDRCGAQVRMRLSGRQWLGWPLGFAMLFLVLWLVATAFGLPPQAGAVAASMATLVAVLACLGTGNVQFVAR
jgi:hypothetical protein